MQYVSTRGGVAPIEFKDAIMMGLATDGGLIVPESVPQVSHYLEDWNGLSYSELAFQIIRLFSDDISDQDLERMVSASYARFKHAEVAPLLPVGSLSVLELFHGPTLAFKDIALQLLGELSRTCCLSAGRPSIFSVPPVVIRARLRLRRCVVDQVFGYSLCSLRVEQAHFRNSK